MLFIFDNSNNFTKISNFGFHARYTLVFNFCGIHPLGFISHEILTHVLRSSTTVLLILSLHVTYFGQAAPPQAFNIYIYIYIYIYVCVCVCVCV